MDAIKGYKTLLFNAIMTIGMTITVWTGVDTSGDVTVITEGLETILSVGFAIWGIGATWLRAITNSPMFHSR